MQAVVRAEMEASIADARAGKRNLDVLLSLFRFNLQTGDSGVGQRVQAFHTDMAAGPADGDWDFFAAGLAATGARDLARLVCSPSSRPASKIVLVSFVRSPFARIRLGVAGL